MEMYATCAGAGENGDRPESTFEFELTREDQVDATDSEIQPAGWQKYD